MNKRNFAYNGQLGLSFLGMQSKAKAGLGPMGYPKS